MSAAISTPATDRDATNFTASVLAEHVPLGVELITDLILKPHFAEADLEREKDVVLQELGEARDTPSDIIFDDLSGRRLSPISRSAARSSATRRASTRSRVDDLHDWRRDRYRAGSLALVAAGKVDHERLVDLAAGPVRRSSRRDDRAARAGALHRRRPGRPVGAATRPISLSASRRRPSSIADYYAARMFSDIVGGGMSSRLFQQVREDRGLAYSVYSQLHPYARHRPVLRLCRHRPARIGLGGAADRGDRRRDGRRPSPSASSTGSGPSPAPAC